MTYRKKLVSITYELCANNVMIGYMNCVNINEELNIEFLIKESKLMPSGINPIKFKIDSGFKIDNILSNKDVKDSIPTALLGYLVKKYLVVYEVDIIDHESEKIKVIEWRNENEQFYMAENMKTKKLLSLSDRSIEEVIEFSIENLI